MLKLHSLEISGFKTFVDPVKLTIADGITAIVGPNGCGKSNLAEGLTWVLGEQSAKSLRGAKMEDVIFNGSSNRKPIGSAEVTLTLKTDPSFAAAENGQVLIGRRVFRSGASQYRLNGKVVRLKQIKDLLMDTGLGIRAYSVIEQGKIGMILSGKPQERRKLLEEAAGVTRYKARKRVAEVKLEEATANLLRLEDIISEIRRALRSLKRQAGAARRYQEQELAYRDFLSQVLMGRWALQSERLSQLGTALEELTDHDAELAAELHREQATLVKAREELDVLARQLGERHQEQANLAATIEGRQEFVRGSRQRLGEIAERIAKGRQQAAERRGQIELMGTSLGDLDQRTVQLVADHAEAERLVAEDEQRIAAAQKDVEQAEARLENLRRELMSSLSRLNQMRSELQRQEVEIERKSYRRRYLDEEKTRLDGQLQEARAILERIDEKVKTAQEGLDGRQDQRNKLNSTLESLLRREAELSEERRQLDNQLTGLRQRQQILQELNAEHVEKRRTLVAKLAEIGIDEPRFLTDELCSPAGWEDGIDHFLGELSDAVLLDGDQDILDLARRLSHLNCSGIFLRPLTDAAAKAEVAEIEDPSLSYSLAEALDLPPEKAYALPPAYLVATAEDAARLAEEHPGIAFISRDRLWAQGGTVRVQGEQAAPGVLARSSELETIAQEIPASEERLRGTGETLRGLVEQRTRHAKDIHRLDEEISELRSEIAVAQARRQDAEGRVAKLHSQRDTITDEDSELQEALNVAAGQSAEQSQNLTEAEARHHEMNEQLDSAQVKVDGAKERRETLRTAGAGRRGRLELLEERLESQQQEAVRVRRQVEENDRQLAAWEQEEEVLERRQRELELGIEQAEEELQIALENRSTAQEAVLAQQSRLDDERLSVRRYEDRVEELRKSREELRSRIEKLRIEQASERQDAEHLAVTFREEFKKYLPGSAPEPVEQLSLEGMEAGEDTDKVALALAQEEGEVEDEPNVIALEADDAISGSDGEVVSEPAAEDAKPAIIEELLEVPSMTPSHLAELEADLSRCKGALERLGPVNVLAATEYDEQSDRYTFLTTQRDDVRQSVESLQRTILEINQTSGERFRETFAQVNITFAKTFARLFRGGEAEMRLLDEDDILETGIEIIARPPGKRTQNIMLLSGGEKALTAIALLFALFQTKPSPFCILDEVDAPLDDVNVLRFAETLKEMATDTQFLIITHNKLTMEIASTLYGVTMEERGISKLVSVELDDVHPAEQAATA